jgi:hypothetical protein
MQEPLEVCAAGTLTQRTHHLCPTTATPDEHANSIVDKFSHTPSWPRARQRAAKKKKKKTASHERTMSTPTLLRHAADSFNAV